MNTLFKALALIFALLFLWSAYVQYNDPDAFQWYLIYGVAALASLLFFFDKLGSMVGIVLSIAYFIYAIVLWPETFEGVTIGEGNIVNIERGREALGMCIVAGTMLLYALRVRYLKKRSEV